MYRRVAILMGLIALCSAAGCRNCDLVEAELRTRENELRSLQGQLEHERLCNQVLQRETLAMRQGIGAPTPEWASQTYTLKEVTLGRLTGGYHEGECPGDQALQVVIEPKDVDGSVIKAPGSAQVEVQEITPEGVKVPLSAWDIPPEKLRRSWRSGFMLTGYTIVLPWKTWPNFSKLRVGVRFTSPDNRVFEADRDVTIQVTPIERRGPEADVPRSAPAAIVPDEVLPTPAPVGPQLDPKTPSEMKPPSGPLLPASGHYFGSRGAKLLVLPPVAGR